MPLGVPTPDKRRVFADEEAYGGFTSDEDRKPLRQSNWLEPSPLGAVSMIN